MICNQMDHNVFLADLKTGKIVRTIKTGFGPHETAVSPSGRLVAVSNYGTAPQAEGPGNSITLISLPAGKVLKTVSLGDYKRPHGLAWLDENHLFATSEVSACLLLVDVQTEKVVRTFPTSGKGSHMLALAKDGSRVYSANVGSANVTAFDVATGKVLGQMDVQQGSEGIGISPDARWVWTGNRGAKSVSVIDTKTLKNVENVPTPGLPYRIQFTKDGKRVLVPCPVSGDLAVFDAHTHREIKRIGMNAGSEKFHGQEPNPGPVGVTVHPNGHYAYCAVHMARAVAIIDLDKLAVVGQIPAGTSPDGLAVSKIAVQGEA